MYRLTLEYGGTRRRVDVVDYGDTEADVDAAIARGEAPGILTSILWTPDEHGVPYGMPVKRKGWKVYGETATKRDRDRLAAHLTGL
jgi:hypothetical protein